MTLIKRCLTAILPILFFGCAGNQAFTVKQSFATEKDYPNVVSDMQQIDDLPEYDMKSFKKVQDEITRYAELLNCEEKGRVMLKLVVTRDATVQPLAFEEELGSACNSAVLQALPSLKFTEPAKSRGTPVDFIISLPVSFS